MTKIETGLIELHENGDRFDVVKAARVHLRQDGRFLAGSEVGLHGPSGGAAAGDAHIGNVDRVTGVVDEAEGVDGQGPTGDGAEILGKFVKQAVGPGGGMDRRGCGQEDRAEKTVPQHGDNSY